MPHARHLALAAALALFACGDDPPKPDRTPPVVTLTAPTDGERVGADGLVVRGTVIDPKVSGQRRSGVAGVEVNGVAATLGTADAAGLASFEATLADLAPGVLVVEAVAADGRPRPRPCRSSASISSRRA